MQLDKAYASLDEVVEGLKAIEQAWSAPLDRRVIFATVYRMMSEAMRARIAQRKFEDNAWVTRYTIAFANLYREALRDYERGAITAVPKAWQLSFGESKAGRALVVQDLLLGVSAHINHDLALALHAVGIKTDRAKRRRDHEAVNQVLASITDEVQEKVAAMYARGLAAVDRWSGRFDEEVAGFGIRAARESAWSFAVALTTVRFEIERLLIRNVLERTSALVGRGILLLSANPGLAAKLRAVEQGGGVTWPLSS